MIKRLIAHVQYHSRKFRDFLCQFPLYCSDYTHTMISFRKIFRVDINLENPKTFNEKINWRKVYDRPAVFTQFSDKLAVREYVYQRIGQEYLIDILQVVRKPGKIDFASLPESFVIKANHGSGMNLFIHNKKTINLSEIHRTCKSWLRTNYYAKGREWGYKHVQPRILIEPLLKRDGEVPLGFKFFCFDGKVKVIQTDIFTSAAHYRNLYTPSWDLLPYSYNYPTAPFPIAPPGEINKMTALAETLADGYDFLRIDLYNHFGKIYFNEITIYPFAGFARFEPEEFDQILGSYWQLPAIEQIKWSPIRKISEALDYFSILMTRLLA